MKLQGICMLVLAFMMFVEIRASITSQGSVQSPRSPSDCSDPDCPKIQNNSRPLPNQSENKIGAIKQLEYTCSAHCASCYSSASCTNCYSGYSVNSRGGCSSNTKVNYNL